MKFFVAGMLTCAGVLVSCFGGPVIATGQIVVATFPENEVLLQVPLENETQFSLSFIHSVSKTRVIDVYEIRGKEIIQTREYFSTHGAGLPSSPNEPGGIRWEKQGSWFVLHMVRPIPKLVVRTDKNYENRLKVPGRTINLNQWEDQALLLYIKLSPFGRAVSRFWGVLVVIKTLWRWWTHNDLYVPTISPTVVGAPARGLRAPARGAPTAIAMIPWIWLGMTTN